MASRFRAGGTVDDPNERDDPWRKAEEDLEAQQRRKANEGKEHDGKSLYEVLQANKAAKQEAFQESIQLKNQFRPLDEDEAEFLDQLLESTRAQEDKVRQETVEQLEIFRQKREETHKLPEEASGATQNEPEEQWTLPGRKRRRMKENATLLPGIKRKKASLSNPSGNENGNNATKRKAGDESSPSTRPQPKAGDESKGKRLNTEDSEHDDKHEHRKDEAKKSPERVASPPNNDASDPSPNKTSPPAPRSAKPANTETKPKEPASTQPRKTLLGLGDYDSDDD